MTAIHDKTKIDGNGLLNSAKFFMTRWYPHLKVCLTTLRKNQLMVDAVLASGRNIDTPFNRDPKTRDNLSKMPEALHEPYTELGRSITAFPAGIKTPRFVVMGAKSTFIPIERWYKAPAFCELKREINNMLDSLHNLEDNMKMFYEYLGPIGLGGGTAVKHTLIDDIDRLLADVTLTSIIKQIIEHFGRSDGAWYEQSFVQCVDDVGTDDEEDIDNAPSAPLPEMMAEPDDPI